MLNRHDRTVLADIERALVLEAPDLVASFDEWREKPPAARHRRSIIAVWLTTALLLAGLVLASAVLFWLGALSVGTLLGVRRWQNRTAVRRRDG